MKLWFRLWTGHILLVATILWVLTDLLLVREVARAVSADLIFFNFVLLCAAVISTMICGAFTAYTYRTEAERRAILTEDALNQEALPPVGADEIVEWASDPRNGIHRVHGAQVTSQEASDAR